MKPTHLTIAAAGMTMLIGAGCATSVPPKESNILESEPIPHEEQKTTNSEPNLNMEQPPANISSCNVYPMPPASARVTTPFDGTVLPDERIRSKQVRIKTEKGDIVFALLPDDAPCTVSNFVTLAEQGFYDGLVFHRVEPGFVIQGGDPNGNGTGGPGYRFDDEPVRLTYDKGIVAMANAGPNTNGSQFFIMLESRFLPPNYTIFGRVIEGQNVVDAIGVGDVMASVMVQEAAPDTDAS